MSIGPANFASTNVPPQIEIKPEIKEEIKSEIKEEIVADDSGSEYSELPIINNIEEKQNDIIDIEKKEESEVKENIETEQTTIENIVVHKQKLFKDKKEVFGFISFIVPPSIISFISAIHLIDFFKVGNSDVVSIILACSFELATISSLLGIVLLRGLRKITKVFLWFVIILLYGLQFAGNIFASFAFITSTSAQKMYEFFGLNGQSVDDRRIIAVVIGSILSIASFCLVKIGSDYLRNNELK